MNEKELLDSIDSAIAEELLKRLTSGEHELTVADIEAARKYLQHKGHKGASLGAMEELTGKRNLASIPDETFHEIFSEHQD